VNTFMRSAVFPLIVITLLVYLASQTLLSEGKPAPKIPYSRVVQTVRSEPRSIDRVVLERNRGVIVERVDGTRWKATNPSEASQLALERLLIAREVNYDWKNTGSSPWCSLVTSLLPFALLLAFFVFLNSRRDERLRLPHRGAA
jgi:ATP-dependent Zn protease